MKPKRENLQKRVARQSLFLQKVKWVRTTVVRAKDDESEEARMDRSTILVPAELCFIRGVCARLTKNLQGMKRDADES
jgi:hypothetical protein